MTWDRVAIVEQQLDRYLESAEPASARLPADAPLTEAGGLTAGAALALFEDQLTSRQLDVAARELKKTNRSFYTIGSAGHENNAVVGARLRVDDPAFLHYRSGGFVMARARQLAGSTPTLDTLLGVVASSQDPISQGRHKVWGSRPMWIPPQTSTIASHLPKAMGLAFSLARARRLRVETELPSDALVVVSFGDASANHATALSGINTARYAVRMGLPMPILFVCEDNDTGISVPTPEGWIASSFGNLPHLRYFLADGELDEVWTAVDAAVEYVRVSRQPAFLHLRTVRLWGHAGSDAEQSYRSMAEIARIEARDPLLRNARRLVELGVATPAQLRDLVRDTRARVQAVAEEAARRPRLQTTEEVVAPMAPDHPDRVAAEGRRPQVNTEVRVGSFGGHLPEEATLPTARTLAGCLNAALADELLRRPELIVFGEDVGRKGGVYGLTSGLQKRFGPARVFDTLLDETSILGIAQGAAHIGLLPVPEIQYLAYVHNAIDQLRGEAASLQFFSSGQFRNPMVVRVAGLAYQKGFGGHFHNDNSIGALRDIPGLVLAVPSRGDDAARMFRGAVAMAREDGRVVVFLEPIALYHERDLHVEGDAGWLVDYPPPPDLLLPGEVGVHGATDEDADVLLVSYANGLRLSLQAAKRLADEHDLRVRVLDLRWLNPLPTDAIRQHAADVGTVVVVDECRATGGGVADAVVADLAEHRVGRRWSSVRAVDSFVPLGPATAAVLVGVDQIVSTAVAAVGRRRTATSNS
ncbi:MAG TPA: thiamine pyrophosphate-dependent enzyme [Candidatus Limnocylindria bacterium]|nr:thiamine pyrophosphate-dependent enzyme [Candidatus Limnocylindria bacterium]